MPSINNNTTPVNLDALAVGRSNTTAFITVFSTRNPTSNDVNYTIQQRWYNTVQESEWILTGFSVVNEVKTAIWQPINSSVIAVTETLTGNSGGPVGVDGTNNINVIGDGTTVNVAGNPGTHTLTITAIGGARIPWTVIGASQTLAVNNGYICGAGGTLSLAMPATSVVGDIVEVTLDGSTGWVITQSAGQHIRIGSSVTTTGAGGSLASTAAGDTLRMVCRTANTFWDVLSSMGNITIV